MPQKPQLSEKAAHFVTLQNAFHPESAHTILVTPVADDDNDSFGKWGAIWTEATLVAEPGTPPSSVVIEETEIQPSTALLPRHLTAVTTGTATSSQLETVPEAPFYHGHAFDILFGLTMALAAVAATFGLELSSTPIYLIAVLCDQIATRCRATSVPFRLICLLFLLIDSILLIVSVLTTEILASIAWLLTTLSTGLKIGGDWHQYIRKLCHISRWAFRHFHKDWRPNRVFTLPGDSFDHHEVCIQ